MNILGLSQGEVFLRLKVKELGKESAFELTGRFVRSKIH